MTATYPADAACITIGHEAFYPEDDQHADSVYAKSRPVCIACPVMLECLDDAMRHETGGRDSRFGMWGGTTPRERAVLATGRVRAS